MAPDQPNTSCDWLVIRPVCKVKFLMCIYMSPWKQWTTQSAKIISWHADRNTWESLVLIYSNLKIDWCTFKQTMYKGLRSNSRSTGLCIHSGACAEVIEKFPIVILIFLLQCYSNACLSARQTSHTRMQWVASLHKTNLNTTPPVQKPRTLRMRCLNAGENNNATQVLK